MKKPSMKPSALIAASRTVRRRWGRLTLVQRAQQVQALVGQGISRRALASRLGLAEGTVRRYLKIAQLPASERDAINAGRGAERILARISAEAARVERQRQHAAEVHDEAVSRAMAELLLRWVELAGLRPAFVRQLFDEVRRQIYSDAFWAQRCPHQFRLPRSVRTGPTTWAFVLACEPSAKEYDFELARLAEWLTRWLPRVVPDSTTRERVLRKAEAALLGN